jgi:glycosyltransferase involved in cell wall biosynthesis
VSKSHSIWKSPYRIRNSILRRANLLQGKLYDACVRAGEDALGILWGAAQWRTNNIESSRKKTVLVCRFKYYSESNRIDSLEKFHIDNALEMMAVDIEYFYWDADRRPIGNQVEFIEAVLDIQPDVVVLSSYVPIRNKRPISQPAIRVLRQMKKRTSAKFVALWWDSCNQDFVQRNIVPMDDIIDLHVLSDNPLSLGTEEYDWSTSEFRERCLALYPPYNPEDIFQPLEKNLDVVFLGKIGSYRSYRRDYLLHLMKCNIAGCISSLGSDSEFTHEEFAEIMGRAKIGINFSFSSDRDQLKGRVFQTMLSGAMLLESENSQTACLFEDGKEYVSFTTKEDLREKITYYLEHDKERTDIADRGRERTMQCYSGKNYWDSLFEKLGGV